MRVAAIDCGTNTIRLLVADASMTPRGVTLVDVHREMRVVRLGEGVDRTGLHPDRRAGPHLGGLSDYAAILRSSGAVRVRMAATSATRDADNRQQFVDLVTSTLGQAPEVITGEEEAELSFRGAVGDLDPGDGPFLVTDIGGGSTEIVVGSSDRHGGVALAGSVSVDLGSVRFTERILHGDPPTAAEIAQARELISTTLTQALAGLPVSPGADGGRGLRNGHHGGRGGAAAAELRPDADPSGEHQRPSRSTTSPSSSSARRRRTAARWATCTRAGSTSSAPAR